MDPSLLKEREAFKKRALAQPSVENKSKGDDGNAKKRRKGPEVTKGKGGRLEVMGGGMSSKQPLSSKPTTYKSMSSSSQYKFGVLAKIVNYMKTRHQKGDTHELDIDEILDETHQTDVGHNTKLWLKNEALKNNPKIECLPGEKFKFKPMYNIPNKKALLRLLQKHDLKGYGGVLLDDVEESLPKCDKAIKVLGDDILIITRSNDKKKILFYNDKSLDNCEIDEDIVKLWRSTTVDGMDDNKIEDYLRRNNIVSMQDMGIRNPIPMHNRRGGKRNSKRRKGFKTHNEHMEGILEDYSAK
ncbi:unnamed protein product [Owenia fusiformis]|uniref:Transcription initiation factor IIE subunit beta n=1 Tax=Owenia fusiformis TaxID=6347 RepID=A0A8J1XRK4_OWEFU|nr:unnamed protein product [Owenia fusiformis]